LLSSSIFLSGPFVDTAGTWTRTPQLHGGVLCLGVIRPFDRDSGVALFDDLNRLYHDAAGIELFFDVLSFDVVVRGVIDGLSVAEDDRLRRLVTDARTDRDLI
jgi:hypothetical protein